MFLVEESDNYELYNDEEKKQFLYQLLQHLVLGGPVNQVSRLTLTDSMCCNNYFVSTSTKTC